MREKVSYWSRLSSSDTVAGPDEFKDNLGTQPRGAAVEPV